ncbi:MAG TPA: globin domain-containing protein [Chlorobiota bacterium]|nr:globin domain-containing protein [Chlorobiota bacterium]
MIQHEDKIVVRSSFSRIVADSSTFGLAFYTRLFERAPDIRPLFEDDITQQAAKLVSMLGLIVGSLDHMGHLAPVLVSLGRSHDAYGAKPEHYDMLVEAFADTLNDQFGFDATSAESTAWRNVLGTVGRIMSDVVPDSETQRR